MRNDQFFLWLDCAVEEGLLLRTVRDSGESISGASLSGIHARSPINGLQPVPPVVVSRCCARLEVLLVELSLVRLLYELAPHCSIALLKFFVFSR